MNNNVEIFKETLGSNKVYMEEVDKIIEATSGKFEFFNDEANDIVAFALGNDLTREDADDLVDRLNKILEGKNEWQESWYLGDENEEYVFVN